MCWQTAVTLLLSAIVLLSLRGMNKPTPAAPPLHVLYLGNFRTPWSTEFHIANALERCGCFVDRLDELRFDSESLIRRVGELARASAGVPTVFLFAKGRLEDTGFEDDPRKLASVLRRLKDEAKVGAIACWIFDLMCPEFSPVRYIWARTISAECDAFFTTDGYTLARHELTNGVLLRQASPVEKVRPGRKVADFTCSIAHVGSIYGERSDWRRRMKSAFGDAFRVFNDVRGDELFDLCASATIVVGPPSPYYPEYWSNRLYVMAGYGACYAAPDVQGMMLEGWNGGNTLRTAFDIDEQIKDLCFYLAEEPHHRTIAQHAQQHAFENHRYQHRAAAMIRHLKTLL